MIKLKDLLTEGVYDKGIFKAVFMAGGPGSGKSYVAGQLFGIPEKINILEKSNATLVVKDLSRVNINHVFENETHL